MVSMNRPMLRPLTSTVSDPVPHNGKPTISAIGNSICIDSKASVVSNAYQWLATAINSVVASILKQRIVATTSYATGGAASTTIVSNHLQLLVNDAPGFAICIAWENDVLMGTTLANSLAAARSIIANCQSVGTIPVIVGPLPSFGFSTSTSGARYWDLVHGLSSLCYEKRVPYVDGFAPYGDYAAARPNPLSGYTDASVHPNQAGVLLLASAIASKIDPLIVNENPQLFIGNDATHNLLLNPSFLGTSGSLLTSASGVLPDSCSGYGYGAGNTAVFDLVASADSSRLPWIRGRYAGSTDSQMTISFASKTMATAGFAVGDIIEGGADLAIESGTGFKNVDLWMQFVGSSSVTFSYANVQSAHLLIEKPPEMRYRTPPIAIPAGTTSITLQARFRGYPTFDFYGKVRNPVIRKSLYPSYL
jgi:hypothetical protein